MRSGLFREARPSTTRSASILDRRNLTPPPSAVRLARTTAAPHAVPEPGREVARARPFFATCCGTIGCVWQRKGGDEKQSPTGPPRDHLRKLSNISELRHAHGSNTGAIPEKHANNPGATGFAGQKRAKAVRNRHSRQHAVVGRVGLLDGGGSWVARWRDRLRGIGAWDVFGGGCAQPRKLGSSVLDREDGNT